MATYPTDQFDDLPDDLDRVGAHRGPRARGGALLALLWALLATALLVVVGLFVLAQYDKSFEFGFGGGSTPTSTQATSSPKPTITPVTNPALVAKRNISITVLNATPTPGLETKAGDVLVRAKWVVGLRALAGTNDIKKSIVYFGNGRNEDVARGIALALGLDVNNVRLTELYPGAPITVVLGSDYKG